MDYITISNLEVFSKHGVYAEENTQDSFDYYVAYGLGKIYGCYAFEISEDGTVEVITE